MHISALIVVYLSGINPDSQLFHLLLLIIVWIGVKTFFISIAIPALLEIFITKIGKSWVQQSLVWAWMSESTGHFSIQIHIIDY